MYIMNNRLSKKVKSSQKEKMLFANKDLIEKYSLYNIDYKLPIISNYTHKIEDINIFPFIPNIFFDYKTLSNIADKITKNKLESKYLFKRSFKYKNKKSSVYTSFFSYCSIGK